MNKKSKSYNEKSLANLKPFKPGDDPRRNVSGAPKNTAEMRLLIKEILGEIIETTDSGKKKSLKSRVRKMVEDMIEAGAPADRQNILKGGYPSLLKDEIDHNVKGKIIHVGFATEAPAEDEEDNA